MKKNGTEMWKDAEFLPLGDEEVSVSATSFGTVPLLKDVLTRASGHIAEYHAEGTVKQESESEENIDETASVADVLNKHLVAQGGRLVHKSHRRGNTETFLYLWPDGIADLTVINDSYASFTALSQNDKFVVDLKAYFDDKWAPIEKTGHIYAIVRQGMNLSLSSIGNAGIPLVLENYTLKVQDDYKFVITDLQSETPSGRITIMRGPAGTGKTHLIRAMLLEVPDAMFVLISPEIVTNLAGPELLPLLMNYRGGSTGPIVLILEDADKCLVKRENENMSLIQSLLNLGDGILGSLLDIRIVATTNADELNLDKAITRPGRLSKMLDVNALDIKTARAVFARLCPNVTEEISLLNGYAGSVTLAEVYALARQNGWKAAERKVDEADENENPDWDE